MSAMPEQDRHQPIDAAAVAPRLRSLASRLLGRGALHASRIAHAHLATLGATRWEYSTLVALRDNGPASQAALSERTGVHRGDMVAVLGSLAAAGYVDRAPDSTDRRRNIVTLTPAGRTQLHMLDRAVDDAQQELLAPLSPVERAELVRLLNLLDDHHSAR
jgi:MarR family transcriptional regulator, lower aerobic nicotinate degradation pathway regulator